MQIYQNLEFIKKQLPSNIQLVAVSKKQPIEAIWEAYNAGQRVFGENKAQETAIKFNHLPKDIIWHFIGHLQTNKVKYIAPFVKLIQSVESLNLLLQINKEAKKNNRIIDCLLQIYIAKEESKFGFDFNEVVNLLNSELYSTLKNIHIIGIMGMATYTNDKQIVRTEFQQLIKYFKTLKEKFFINDIDFKEISMGMSNDFQIAVEEGSTIVRIGSSIFGERVYKSI